MLADTVKTSDPDRIRHDLRRIRQPGVHGFRHGDPGPVCGSSPGDSDVVPDKLTMFLECVARSRRWKFRRDVSHQIEGCDRNPCQPGGFPKLLPRSDWPPWHPLLPPPRLLNRFWRTTSSSTSTPIWIANSTTCPTKPPPTANCLIPPTTKTPSNPPSGSPTLDLPAALLRAVEKLGFTTPSEIQEQAIPALLSGRDITGVAQTGTGKTAAFGLPLLASIDPVAPSGPGSGPDPDP